jgi:hypothetical protein
MPFIKEDFHMRNLRSLRSTLLMAACTGIVMAGGQSANAGEAAPTTKPFSMLSEPRPPMNSMTLETQRVQAVLERFPEMATGPARDGRIDRENIRTIPMERLQIELPPAASPEHLKVLGLTPQELGTMGMTMVARPVAGAKATTVTRPNGQAITQPPEQELLTVLYAWPRDASRQTAGLLDTPSMPAGSLLPLARIELARAVTDSEYQLAAQPHRPGRAVLRLRAG